MNRLCKIDVYLGSLFNNAYVKLKNILNRRFSYSVLIRFNENFHWLTFKTLGLFSSYKYKYDFMQLNNFYRWIINLNYHLSLSTTN